MPTPTAASTATEPADTDPVDEAGETTGPHPPRGRLRLLRNVAQWALVAIAALVGVRALAGAGISAPAAPTDERPRRPVSSISTSSPTTTTTIPLEDERARPAIDVAHQPELEDPREVSRWWAATYSSLAGSLPPSAVARRLAPASSAELTAALAEAPAAATYDPPLPVWGASVSPVHRVDARTVRVVVSVEAPDSLVAFAITVGWASPGWRVTGATTL